jgi:hypothetical protein
VALTIETAGPFLTWLPRRARRLGFALQAALQGLIAITGSYGFFNLLSLVLSTWMLDDAALERTPPRRLAPREPRWSSVLRLLVEMPLAALSGLEFAARFRRLPRKARSVLAKTRPFALPGGYGLFAVMTRDRPQVVIEGSEDGVTWREYVLRYQPGPVDRPPRQAAPHQPRLDWQLWFAALGPPPPWFATLLVRLLEGVPEVLAQFDTVPFERPLAVRARLYRYRMSDLATRRRTGAWWQRELLGTYFPAITVGRREEANLPVPGADSEWVPVS